MNVEDIQALLDEQKRAGAVVKPLSEAPADIQRMAEEDAPLCMGYKPHRRPTPVWRVTGGGKFRYEDGEFACEIADVRLDVFLAFTMQLQVYAEAVVADKLDKAFNALARAYALIHHRPRWWERWFRSVYFVNVNRARNRMILDIPARAIYTFLPLALAAYHAWVTGKKKSNGEAVDIPVMEKPLSSSPTKPESESGSC